MYLPSLEGRYIFITTKNLVSKEWGFNPARALWIFEAKTNLRLFSLEPQPQPDEQ